MKEIDGDLHHMCALSTGPTRFVGVKTPDVGGPWCEGTGGGPSSAPGGGAEGEDLKTRKAISWWEKG